MLSFFPLNHEFCRVYLQSSTTEKSLVTFFQSLLGNKNKNKKICALFMRPTPPLQAHQGANAPLKWPTGRCVKRQCSPLHIEGALAVFGRFSYVFWVVPLSLLHQSASAMPLSLEKHWKNQATLPLRI
jgi:hypothetical protein